MTKIEEVARAIYDTMPVGERGWDDAPVYTRDRCRVVARAAIAALREPSEAEFGKACDAALLGRPYQGYAYSAAVWRAMIDGMLAEEPEAKP